MKRILIKIFGKETSRYVQTLSVLQICHFFKILSRHLNDVLLKKSGMFGLFCFTGYEIWLMTRTRTKGHLMRIDT